jgi:hypothetical protein
MDAHVAMTLDHFEHDVPSDFEAASKMPIAS